MRLILTAEQSKKLSSVVGEVEVIDSVGRTIGHFTLTEPTVTKTQELSAADFDELRRHISETATEKGPAFKTEQVREHS